MGESGSDPHIKRRERPKLVIGRAFARAIAGIKEEKKDSTLESTIGKSSLDSEKAKESISNLVQTKSAPFSEKHSENSRVSDKLYQSNDKCSSDVKNIYKSQGNHHSNGRHSNDDDKSRKDISKQNHNSNFKRYSNNANNGCHSNYDDDSYKGNSKYDSDLKRYSDTYNSNYRHSNYNKSVSKCNSHAYDIKSKYSSYETKNYRKKSSDDEKHLQCEFKKIDFQNEEPEDCIEYSEPKHQRVIAESYDGFKISFKNESSSEPISVSSPQSTTLPSPTSVSSPHSTTVPSPTSVSSLSSVPSDSNLLPVPSCHTLSSEPLISTSPSPDTAIHSAPLIVSLPSNDVLSQISKDSNLTDCTNACMLLCSEEDGFIPPPVIPSAVNDSETTTRNGNLSLCKDLESPVEVMSCPEEDEIYPSITDPKHLQAITSYILKVVKERTVSCHPALKVVRDLTRLFKNYFEGNVIEFYGSYYSELAITTSDINLVVQADVSIRKSFLFEVYKVMSSELEKYHVHPYEEGTTAHKTKINFSHPDTGINCELAYLGKNKDNVFEMGKFLKTMSLMNYRVKTLIIAVKIWAEYLTINEVEDGKLHPVGFALLVIHFLQICENPILPVYSSYSDHNKNSNSSSVGELWVAFLKYYSVTFNWKRDVVTVNSKEIVSKKSKQWENYWMAIEDPFTGKNIAETVVNCDVAEYIKACFKSSCAYFCNPPVISDSSSNEDCEDNSKSSSCQYEFSFQHCFVEQNDAYCEKCEEIEDVCNDCKQKLYIQPVASMPKMTDSFLNVIKTALMTIYDKYMLSEEEIIERKEFVKKIQKEVCKVYSDAQLNLFGSSTNGFGFKNSDLDICITFETEKINPDAVLKRICHILRKDKNFDHVIPIFNATIPIIKFHYEPKGWRGDISLANTLAVHNSELLYTYSLIDERCKILGCALKLVAKKALVAEVTEKALSSYSYLNMVIHFLQQVEPPVLPVLQDNKFRENNFKLDHIVQNCNVWFCKDLDYIKRVFKIENVTPVEQLWLDLLDYYCSFDNEKCISIREKETRYIKGIKRSSRLFNIQDPFIETKNLGCVVSGKKADETKNVFNRARQLFRTPVKELPSGVKDIEDYFFSTMSLTGRIHKEALCNLCGKFGHERKECKQSGFPLWRPRFGQFRKYNAYNKNGTCYRKPINRPPYRKQFSS